MPLMDDELARRENGQVTVRQTPVRIRWELGEMTTADGHRLRGHFTASVQALSDRNNRAMLEEVFLSRAPAVTSAAIVAHFAPALSAASIKIASSATAAQWVGDETVDRKDKANTADVRRGMVEAIRKAAESAAFSCGLEILEPLTLELDSPSFRQQKVEAMERALAEKRVAGQVEHFEKAVTLLKQFETIRQSAPELTPSAVLQQVSPADRGAMLQTLLLAAGRQKATQSIWLVAGNTLVRVDRPSPLEANGMMPHVEQIQLPTQLGPLRSIEPVTLDGRPMMLLGARGGVILCHPDGSGARLFIDNHITSQLGFSRALLFNNALWACHSEAGVVRWNLDDPSTPAATIAPADLASLFDQSVPPAAAPPMVSNNSSYISGSETPAGPAVRHLTVLDEQRLVACFGPHLLTISVDGNSTPVPLPDDGQIVALVPDDRRLLVVWSTGRVRALDRATLDVVADLNRNTRIAAAGALPWLGSTRLLLAGDGPIQCVGMDDPLISEFVSPHRAPRQVAATTDLVAAVSADRQRLILWNAWDGHRPVADLAITALCRHRIADVDFS